ncbi:MAG: NADPH-dependent FMN reductase [Bacteroidota bacterium]
MCARKKVLAISGSIRKNSVNTQLLKRLKEMFAPECDIEIYEKLDMLPFFNPDLENTKLPFEVERFRNEISKADGVLICTPEYVFSIPAILKNAIEWTVSTVVFTDKPVAIITASTSGEKAHESLLLVMKTLGAKIEDDSTILIRAPKTKIDAEGAITDKETLNGINTLMNTFLNSIVSQ